MLHKNLLSHALALVLSPLHNLHLRKKTNKQRNKSDKAQKTLSVAQSHLYLISLSHFPFFVQSQDKNLNSVLFGSLNIVLKEKKKLYDIVDIYPYLSSYDDNVVKII